MIDGNVVGTWVLTTGGGSWVVRTASFNVATGGTHTLEFEGLSAGDNTAFLTDVAINRVVPEPSSLLMMVSGILGLAGVVRRKRSV